VWRSLFKAWTYCSSLLPEMYGTGNIVWRRRGTERSEAYGNRPVIGLWSDSFKKREGGEKARYVRSMAVVVSGQERAFGVLTGHSWTGREGQQRLPKWPFSQWNSCGARDLVKAKHRLYCTSDVAHTQNPTNLSVDNFQTF
jgi:hypothetical protein